MNMDFRLTESSFCLEFKNGENVIQSTNDLNKVKTALIQNRYKSYKEEVMQSNWQGMIYKSRYEDENLIPGCFDWLKNWKSAPINVIRDIFDLYCQTLKTKCFEITRSNSPPANTICRMCKSGNETVHVVCF